MYSAPSPQVVYLASAKPYRPNDRLTRLCCCCCLDSRLARSFSRLNTCFKLCILLPLVLLVLAALVVVVLIIYLRVGVHSADPFALDTLAGQMPQGVLLESPASNIMVFRATNASSDPTARRGLVFVPELKVDMRSYAPYAVQVAAAGYTVALVQPPLNFPPFAYPRVQDAMSSYPGTRFALGGHGWGAISAFAFVTDKSSSSHALVMLGAALKPNAAFTQANVQAVVVYGSEDRIVQPQEVEESRSAVDPAHVTFVEINGGNHAQFGSYGTQGGDGTPTIDAAQQQSQAANATVQLLATM